jgi:Mn-containing catalase
LKAVAKVKERLLKKAPAAPANKQTAGVPAVVETQGQTVVTLSFNGQISKPLAGKAVDSVSAPERAGYITGLTQAIEDLKENQPKGWEARLKAMEAHLVAVTDVHEQLAAEAAMANEG